MTAVQEPELHVLSQLDRVGAVLTFDSRLSQATLERPYISRRVDPRLVVILACYGWIRATEAPAGCELQYWEITPAGRRFLQEVRAGRQGSAYERTGKSSF